ncbi:hypothetical protein BDY24DRAFT_340048, partial [Mrakia frigida]|uniref:Rco1p n=1 Tax=Mrakia frigida TaxID=29902 RepID=UPI003FCC102E
NNDYCEACRGNGRFLCCDGCPRSFHFSCLDPPIDMDNVPEDQWFCVECALRRGKRALPRAPPNIFGPLVTQLQRSNATQYQLPEEIRNFFKGVTTSANGNYVDSDKIRTLKLEFVSSFLSFPFLTSRSTRRLPSFHSLLHTDSSPSLPFSSLFSPVVDGASPKTVILSASRTPKELPSSATAVEAPPLPSTDPAKLEPSPLKVNPPWPSRSGGRSSAAITARFTGTSTAWIRRSRTCRCRRGSGCVRIMWSM